MPVAIGGCNSFSLIFSGSASEMGQHVDRVEETERRSINESNMSCACL